MAESIRPSRPGARWPFGCRRSFWLAGMGLFLCVPQLAFAQSANLGSRFAMQSGESRGLFSKDALGKPCLDIEAASRAHVSNPNVFDHIVSVANRCSRTIKVKVCYFGTDKCTDIQAAGMQRKDAILGIQPGMKTFRYSSVEKR